MVIDCNIAYFSPIGTPVAKYHSNMLNLEQTYISVIRTYQLL